MDVVGPLTRPFSAAMGCLTPREKITDIYGKEKAEDISTDRLHLELTETPIYLDFSYPFSRMVSGRKRKKS